MRGELVPAPTSTARSPRPPTPDVAVGIRLYTAGQPSSGGQVTVSLRSLTFDAHDPRALALFWARLTGWHLFYDDDPQVIVAPHFPVGDALMLLFNSVPERKSAKNRIHVDLVPTDCTRDEQVERALALGATLLNDFRKPDGRGFVVMADPEGNEFCVERAPAELAPRGPLEIGLTL
jgi:hypothetical protein